MSKVQEEKKRHVANVMVMAHSPVPLDVSTGTGNHGGPKTF